jgi:hypothetical protein
LRGLNHQLKQLCRHNREGSYGTQVQRERELTLIANQLHEIGYRGMNSHSLKPKHVEALVRHWLETDVATGHHQEPHVRLSLVGEEGEPAECGGEIE